MRTLPLLLCLLVTACATPEPIMALEPNAGLDETVAAHIAAIQSRDLAALLETVTLGDDLTLIFPQGTTSTTRQEYVDFHREWFANDGWTMEIKPLSTHRHGDTGIALVRTTYTDEAGPRQAMLALTFAREGGDWRLVFDQNTRIVED